MRKRIRLKRKITIFKKNGRLKVFICILVLGIILLVLCFRFISNKASPILMEYAELETRKIASIIINNAVAKNVTENIDIEELFLITKDDDGQIKTIDFNPITVNKILTQTTNSVQVNLKYIEQGKVELLDISNNALLEYDLDKLKQGIIYEIPSGVVFNNALLSNLGPKVPVKFNLVGNIVSYINTKVTNYGINNALIEVNIVLELSEQVILPFLTDKIQIMTSVPVALKLIQGTVPNYYFNGMDQNSPSLAIPIE